MVTVFVTTYRPLGSAVSVYTCPPLSVTTTVAPGMGTPVTASLIRPVSTVCNSVSESVLLLFAPLVSTMPTGTVTSTVFRNVPTAIPLTTAASVKVTRLVTLKLTVALMPPVPLAGTGQAPPALAAHLHVADVTPLGSESLTTAPLTCAGPLFSTTMVYVTVAPGAVVVIPSVLVTLRSVRSWKPKSLPEDVWPAANVPVIMPGVVATKPTGGVPTVRVNAPADTPVNA